MRVYTFDEVVERGKQNKSWKATEPKPDDCPMFSYTSGTTGDPKGVKMTHLMQVSAVASCNVTNKFNSPGAMGPEDTYISYLPSAHSFEALLFTNAIVYGTKVGYYGGDVLKLIKEDMPLLKPTIFPSVPRVYNKIFGMIKTKFGELTGCKAWLAKKAVTTKLANIESTGNFCHGCYDKILFKKVKNILGGNVRMMLTGSAPISAEVMNFIEICFSCNMYEGYGMTETMAGSVMTKYGDPRSGHVGGPAPNVKIRLRDIPEMEYTHQNNPPKGEVCFWGPSIMKGYYKNPEKTAEAFDGEWLLSGDVAQINPNGSITIVDRAKNIFKLSQGEYIAPEKLENQYIKSDFVAQIWIHGDSLHDWIVVFIVIDPDKVKPWAKERSILYNDALMDSTELKKEVMKSLASIAADNKFNSLERPKQIKLIKDMWTIESDMLTPTMKTKRNIAKIRYTEDIKKMYAAGPFKT